MGPSLLSIVRHVQIEMVQRVLLRPLGTQHAASNVAVLLLGHAAASQWSRARSGRPNDSHLFKTDTVPLPAGLAGIHHVAQLRRYD